MGIWMAQTQWYFLVVSLKNWPLLLSMLPILLVQHCHYAISVRFCKNVMSCQCVVIPFDTLRNWSLAILLGTFAMLRARAYSLKYLKIMPISILVQPKIYSIIKKMMFSNLLLSRLCRILALPWSAAESWSQSNRPPTLTSTCSSWKSP